MARRIARYISFVIAGMMLLTMSMAIACVSRAGAAGIAGPDQTVAEGLPVLLGDPAKSGTDPGDTDPGASYHWRQIILGSEPYVKLSHIDKTTTMFIAPDVSRDTVFRFSLTRNAEAEVTADVTVVNLAADSPSNTTFVDHAIVPATCDTYDPVTRTCGSGTYKAQKTSFKIAWYPLPTPGWRYVFREGTYRYAKTPAGACHPVGTGVVRIEGTNGTAIAPVQFKTYKNGAIHEHVLLDVGGVTDCPVYPQVYIAGSSYVIAEGFEITGNNAKGSTGPLVSIGHFAAAGGSFAGNPSHHITIRHFRAHDHCFTSDCGVGGVGLFAIRNPSHEIALQYVEGYNGAGGATLGISHRQEKALLPYNVFVHTASFHDNLLNAQGSPGTTQQGLRNSGFYRVLAYNNSDGGIPHGQGPHMDSNTFWDVVSFRQDSILAQNFTGSNWGNERGAQIGTVSVPGRGAFANRVYRSVFFDNMGNGFNDVGGAIDTQAYNMTVFNNCRRRRFPTGNAMTGHAGIIAESRAGTNLLTTPHPPPGLTLTNTVSYWNGQTTGCQGAGPVNISVVSYAVPYTTLITSSPRSGGNPGFVAATPQSTPSTVVDAPESDVTVDVRLYADRAMRTLNPNFGAVTGLQLQLGSPAIDAGTFVSGVHCDRPDDGPTPYPVNDPNCIHWYGRAPDVGAYEYGIEVHPTSTKRPSTPTGLQVR